MRDGQTQYLQFLQYLYSYTVMLTMKQMLLLSSFYWKNKLALQPEKSKRCKVFLNELFLLCFLKILIIFANEFTTQMFDYNSQIAQSTRRKYCTNGSASAVYHWNPIRQADFPLNTSGTGTRLALHGLQQCLLFCRGGSYSLHILGCGCIKSFSVLKRNTQQMQLCRIHQECL